MDINNKLINAAEYGDLDEVKYAIKNGADIHTRCDAPLRRASEYGHLEIVKFLVKNGANFCDWMNAPLRLAIRNNHYEIVKFLEPIYVKNMWNKVKWLEIKGKYNRHK